MLFLSENISQQFKNKQGLLSAILIQSPRTLTVPKVQVKQIFSLNKLIKVHANFRSEQDTEYFLRLFKSQISGWEVTQVKAS